MTILEAKEFLHSKMESVNLRRHCYAVSVVMGALAVRLGHKEDREKWEVAGMLHDADYEVTKTDTAKHTHLVLEWLKDHTADAEIHGAILAHGWNYVPGNPQPKNDMEWALYCCDELTGLIVATALVKPDKKLSLVSVESVMNKWSQKSFAAGVDRKQIELCDEKLHIPLRDFIEIALTAMQQIAPDLGL